MKKNFLLIALFVFSTISQAQTKTFKGSWFEIKYPKSFTAKGSIKSAGMDGFESAVFKSPDGLVEFYIYSPQWSGKPTDITIKSTEKLENSKTETKSGTSIKRWTITAKDKTYSRSYQETFKENENTSFIFGIKYKDQAGLKKHQKEYATFKRSLQQFAD